MSAASPELRPTAPRMPGSLEARADEQRVRLLFLERSAPYGAVVRAALERARRGHFEVLPGSAIGAAAARVAETRCDALLLDWTEQAAREGEIDEAARLAHRLPVIALTGDDAPRTPDEQALARGIAGSPVPGTILQAVQRHRRLGQGGADPIVLRDPLRAYVRAFGARISGLLRGTLGR